jgi:amino acid adenylation domain-containing protein
LIQVMFALQNVPVSNLELPALTANRMDNGIARTRFDLEVGLSETMEGLKCVFVYNTDLFDSATIKRMAGHYQRILEEIVADPDQRLSELPLLTDAERHELLVEWNNTEADYPKEKCIHDLFEEQVERTPDKTAVSFENKSLTYLELNEKANQLAHYLSRQGVGPEVLVGICMERSLDMIIGILGILKAGGAYVPLDPQHPEKRISFMLEDVKPSVLLTQKSLVETLSGHGTRLVCLDTEWTAISKENRGKHASSIGSDDLAYVIYTSGSTGEPKGVMIRHRSVCNHLSWRKTYFPLNESDRLLHTASFSFDDSVWEFFEPLTTGAQLIVARTGAHNDCTYLIKLIIDKQITSVCFVPSLLQAILEQPDIEKCTSLRRVTTGGEVLSVKVQQRFFDCLNACLYNGYGPTEATIGSTYYACRRVANLKVIPIGRPIANTQIFLLNSLLEPVPVGVPGDLYIGGDGLARGYLNRPELTAEKFIPNPFSEEPEARLYKTGDLARYLPDGNIEFLGRSDHQVKIRGFRIELGEIEAVLGQHPVVRKSVIVAREDNPGDRRLVAYIVPSETSAIAPNELRSFLKKRIPDYMIPSAFIVLDSLPLTPNGKVDRKSLQPPGSEHLESENSYAAPRSPIEEVLAGIWCLVLGLNKVGTHDNFFDLGGHSLLATQAISRIRRTFGMDLPLRTLFEFPTVEGMATALLQREGVREKVEQRAALLLRVAELSEAEVNTMFEDQMRRRDAKNDARPGEREHDN